MTGKVEGGTNLFQATMEAAQVGIFVMGEGCFIYVNPFMRELFCYSEDDFQSHIGPLDLVVPEQHDIVAEQLALRAAGVPGKAYELSGRRKDGSVFTMSILGMPARFGNLPVSVGTVLDVTDRKAAELRIRELADFDALTGLPNRRLLYDRVEQMIASAEGENASAALMFLDIDRHQPLSAGRQGHRHAAEERRHGDVQGQGSRSQHVPVLFVRDEHGDARASDDGK